MGYCGCGGVCLCFFSQHYRWWHTKIRKRDGRDVSMFAKNTCYALSRLAFYMYYPLYIIYLSCNVFKYKVKMFHTSIRQILISVFKGFLFPVILTPSPVTILCWAIFLNVLIRLVFLCHNKIIIGTIK